ncbi:MAG: hypothetical protein ING19_06800 [Azospirillum sp.]|nr:hypothetical protein [Azospirillum sp.]
MTELKIEVENIWRDRNKTWGLSVPVLKAKGSLKIGSMATDVFDFVAVDKSWHFQIRETAENAMSHKFGYKMHVPYPVETIKLDDRNRERIESFVHMAATAYLVGLRALSPENASAARKKATFKPPTPIEEAVAKAIAAVSEENGEAKWEDWVEAAKAALSKIENGAEAMAKEIAKAVDAGGEAEWPHWMEAAKAARSAVEDVERYGQRNRMTGPR